MLDDEDNSTSGTSCMIIFDCIITLNFEIFVLLKNVSFRVTMSKLFSFRCNSSSLSYGLTPCQFKRNVCTHENQTSDTCNERRPTLEVLLGTLFGDNLVSEGRGGGGAEKVKDGGWFDDS